MESSTEQVSTGPATSRRIRILLYLSEAMFAGGFLAVYSGIALFVVTARGISASKLLGGGAILFVVFLVLTIRYASAVRKERNISPRTRGAEEWTETRQWRWVIAGTLTVFGLLAIVSGGLITWGEQWVGARRTFQTVVVLVFGTLMVGMGLRGYLQDKLEKNYAEK
jgi:Na+/melibiose symporter-like transporter